MTRVPFWMCDSINDLPLFRQILSRPSLFAKYVLASLSKPFRPADLPRDWTSPPELAGLPRAIRISSPGMVAVVGAIGFGVAGIGLLWGGWRESTQMARTQQRLRTEGEVTQGQILRLTRNKAGSRVLYQFWVGGPTYGGWSLVPAERWEGLQVNQPLAIRFVRADPNVHHPADWQDESELIPMMMSSGLLLVISAGVVFNLRVNARLLANGIPAAAVITGARRARNEWRVRYQFQTASGVLVSGRGSYQGVPAVGATTCVLYDPEAPKRNRLYPLSLYRLAATL